MWLKWSLIGLGGLTLFLVGAQGFLWVRVIQARDRYKQLSTRKGIKKPLLISSITKKLSKALPESVFLTKLQLTTSKIVLSGYAPEQEELNLFLQNFPLLSEPTITPKPQGLFFTVNGNLKIKR